MRRLGHGVCFEDGGVEGLFEVVEDCGGEGGGAGADETDVGEGVGFGGVEEDGVHGGDYDSGVSEDTGGGRIATYLPYTNYTSPLQSPSRKSPH